jgi:hypothetical protein
VAGDVINAPEPSATLLFGAGLGALLAFARLKKKPV